MCVITINDYLGCTWEALRDSGVRFFRASWNDVHNEAAAVSVYRHPGVRRLSQEQDASAWVQQLQTKVPWDVTLIVGAALDAALASENLFRGLAAW